jgi:hypothetical protein
MYRQGKAKLNNKDLLFIEYVEGIKRRKTTLKYLLFLQELAYIRFNEKTGFYAISSFDKIREFHDWKVRLAFPIDYSNYYKIKAVTGAVIYGYLHKDFWRKVKREKSVQLKGCTYYFLNPTFNYKKELAPVSVIGVHKIFNISVPTASRLKNAAHKEKFIKLKKNFSDTVVNKPLIDLYIEYNDLKNNVVFRDGEYRLQLIDTVYPLFYFKKRVKLKT